METLAKGAEANLFMEGGRLVKHRILKGYRIAELDARLRRMRTAREARLLENAKRAGVAVPRIIRVEIRESRIVMEHLAGSSLKDALETSSEKEISDMLEQAGAGISRMHDANIIHNDLTSSNMLYSSGTVYFIDFGLGTTSTRIEDKAMDLVVLKKSLTVVHTQKFAGMWEKILEAYGKTKEAKAILARVNVIEKRARYCG